MSLLEGVKDMEPENQEASVVGDTVPVQNNDGEPSIAAESAAKEEFSSPKDPRSSCKYNCFARIFFCWIDPLFWAGCRRELYQEDLYANPREADCEKLANKFNTYWTIEEEKKKQGRKPNLSLVLFKCLWWRILLQGILFFLEELCIVIQSVVLGYLTEYFTLQTPTEAETRNAYLYAAALVTLAFFMMVLHSNSYLIAQKIGMLARILCTGGVYRKALELSQMSLGQISAGHIINVVSNDVQRFDTGMVYIHFLWISPLHLIVYTVLVYQEVGPSSFVATSFLLLQIPLQLLLARYFAKLRFKLSDVTDKRVRIMNEVISAIRMIKMYAWEYPFKKVVSNLRRKESNIVLHSTIIRAADLAFFTVSLTLIMFLVFSTHALLGNAITTRAVFTTLSLTTTVRLSSIHFFVLCVLGLSEVKVTISRIQSLLEVDKVGRLCSDAKKKDFEDNSKTTPSENVDGNETKGTLKLNKNLFPSTTSATAKVRVNVSGLSASWSQSEENLTISNISFELKDSSLLAVVGPVGSGKSTLMQCLLGELKPVQGSVDVFGKISYASQNSWVFSGTLQENILFGQPYDEQWYSSVITACTLQKDIQMLAYGDQTLIGEAGVSLSGGQRARVNLARAIYQKADIYILEDPLSAVDTSVSRRIFERCIQGLLKDKAVVLVTHQLQFAQLANKILVIKEGCTKAFGTLQQLRNMGINPSKLADLMKKEVLQGEEFVFKDCDDEDEMLENEEAFDEFDGIPLQMPPSFNPTRRVSAASIFSMSMPLEGDSLEEYKKSSTATEESKGSGSVAGKTYWRYFRAGGHIALLITVLVSFLLGEGGTVAADWWISKWAECSNVNSTGYNSSLCGFSTNERVGVYAALTIGLIVFNFVRIIMMVYVTVNASRVLHNKMLKAVLKAKMRFFDTNPVGRALNRFSKDVGFLDDLLPLMFTEFLLLIIHFVAIVVIASIALLWVLIPATIFIVILLFARTYYLSTSRNIKRLEACARSPLYSHFANTMKGLPTIRTFQKEKLVLQHFYEFQNEHSRAWYLYIVSTRWFAMRVDSLSMMFLGIVVFTMLPLSANLSDPSLVGLCLAYTIALANMFQYCMRLSADIENMMVSAERVMQYGELESEMILDTNFKPPPPNWPREGGIVMDDASFQHATGTPLVLNSITCTLLPSEKIGIVGRTGAGKSSLLSMLFRLGQNHGTVMIDGVLTEAVSLHNLRSKLSIIPQDPVLFSGSVRYNLDPFEQYSDADLWDVLEQVQLKTAVNKMGKGLSSEVLEGGSNFSVGQKQLFCLARALLRRNKILILDEATANVDVITDAIVQKTIKEAFADCTVLTIAHRLDTIMDSDRVMVLNRGYMKEFDEPYALMQDQHSLFRKMVEQTGPVAVVKLYQMAVEAHNARCENLPPVHRNSIASLRRGSLTSIRRSSLTSEHLSEASESSFESDSVFDSTSKAPISISNIGKLMAASSRKQSFATEYFPKMYSSRKYSMAPDVFPGRRDILPRKSSMITASRSPIRTHKLSLVGFSPRPVFHEPSSIPSSPIEPLNSEKLEGASSHESILNQRKRIPGLHIYPGRSSQTATAKLAQERFPFLDPVSQRNTSPIGSPKFKPPVKHISGPAKFTFPGGLLRQEISAQNTVSLSPTGSPRQNLKQILEEEPSSPTATTATLAEDRTRFSPATRHHRLSLAAKVAPVHDLKSSLLAETFPVSRYTSRKASLANLAFTRAPVSPLKSHKASVAAQHNVMKKAPTSPMKSRRMSAVHTRMPSSSPLKSRKLSSAFHGSHHSRTSPVKSRKLSLGISQMHSTSSSPARTHKKSSPFYPSKAPSLAVKSHKPNTLSEDSSPLVLNEGYRVRKKFITGGISEVPIEEDEGAYQDEEISILSPND